MEANLVARLRLVKVCLTMGCAQKEVHSAQQQDGLSNRVRSTLGCVIQLASHCALSDQPSLAQNLEFSTIRNKIEVSRILHFSLSQIFRQVVNLLASFQTQHPTTINRGEHFSFAHHYTTHTHTQSPAHTLNAQALKLL